MKVSRSIVTAAFILAVAGSGCIHKLELSPRPELRNPVVDVASDPSLPFKAGFAKEPITPDMRVWMAGYDFLRRSKGVHDDLTARALVLIQGQEKLAMVSLDLVGMNRYDINAIKARVPGFRPDQILIACTHVHAGPDAMGLWGLPPLYSGRNMKAMKKIEEAIIRAIGRAEAAAAPVSAWTAVYQMDAGLMYNMNEGEPKDDTMGIMVFKNEAGGVVATLVNLTGHPEVLKKNNRQISADFPGIMYREIEKKSGGGSLLFNGACGSLITPTVELVPDPDFEDVAQVGIKAAAEVQKGMGLLVREERPSIVHRVSHILVPVENKIYTVLLQFRMFDRDAYEGPALLTEVNLIEIGSAQFITFPGEAYPKQGINLRKLQKPNSFQIGLADDELGYILYPDDYSSKLYKYEAGLCPGPGLAVEIEKALTELLAK
jgi:hypothetical protein